jgi:hypothetical protein
LSKRRQYNFVFRAQRNAVFKRLRIDDFVGKAQLPSQCRSIQLTLWALMCRRY